MTRTEAHSTTTSTPAGLGLLDALTTAVALAAVTGALFSGRLAG